MSLNSVRVEFEIYYRSLETRGWVLPKVWSCVSFEIPAEGVLIPDKGGHDTQSSTIRHMNLNYRRVSNSKSESVSDCPKLP